MLCQNNGGCNHAKVIQDFIHWFSIDWPVLFSLRDQVYLNYVSVFYSCKEEKYKCCHSSVLTLIDTCYTKLLTRVNLCQTEEWEETQATGYLSLYKSSSSFSEFHKAPTSYERVRHAARLRLREQEGGQLRGLVRESVRCDELPGGSQTGTHSGETGDNSDTVRVIMVMMQDTPLNKIQHKFWVAKQKVTRKLGHEEDQHVVASDGELDAKLELFRF